MMCAMQQRPSYRKQRIADLIHQKIAKILQTETRNVLLTRVSVMSVTISPDLNYANVYVSTLEEDATVVKSLLNALNQAKHYLRFALAREIELRVVPELRFFYDESVLNGFKMAKLIDQALGHVID